MFAAQPASVETYPAGVLVVDASHGGAVAPGAGVVATGAVGIGRATTCGLPGSIFGGAAVVAGSVTAGTAAAAAGATTTGTVPATVGASVSTATVGSAAPEAREKSTVVGAWVANEVKDVAIEGAGTLETAVVRKLVDEFLDAPVKVSDDPTTIVSNTTAARRSRPLLNGALLNSSVTDRSELVRRRSAPGPSVISSHYAVANSQGQRALRNRSPIHSRRRAHWTQAALLPFRI